MFVSRKKLRAIVDENVALKKNVRHLKDENTRLSDSNLDLWYDNKLLNAKLMKKGINSVSEVFYGAADEFGRFYAQLYKGDKII